jgi:predicted RNase H-like nuclease (RuvC/YqgF family)
MAKISKTKSKILVDTKNTKAKDEMIRRLRIQNKKLIEQVTKLREQIKKLK